MELVIFSALDGLSRACEARCGAAVISVSQLGLLERLLLQDAPQTCYLDTTRGTPPAELRALIATAQRAQVRVLVGLHGPARLAADSLRAAGVPVCEEHDAQRVAEWIAQQAGITVPPVVRRPVIAVAAAKGGIGKTFVTAVLAEGLRRRGLHVLVWDCDLANPGLVPLFRVPASAPSYLTLSAAAPAGRQVDALAGLIYQPPATRADAQGWGRLDLLLGARGVAEPDDDLRLIDWQAVCAAIGGLSAYDVVLVDTPPDYLRRPYATHILQHDGWVILPAPPGARERNGVAHLLEHFRRTVTAPFERCVLWPVEPEQGVQAAAADSAGRLAEQYAPTAQLNTLPRVPQLAGLADELEEYTALLDLSPYGRFSTAVHQAVEQLCGLIGLQPRRPMPMLGFWQRVRDAALARRDLTERRL